MTGPALLGYWWYLRQGRTQLLPHKHPKTEAEITQASSTRGCASALGWNVAQ